MEVNNRPNSILIIIAILFGLTTWVRGGVPPIPKSHTERVIEGWTVRVDDRLLDSSAVNEPSKELGEHAITLLGNRLFQITQVVPLDKLKHLKKVVIWLDQTHGELTSMQYHPDAGWLKAHGYDAKLAKCVHIPDSRYFTNPALQHEQPWAVLHELAHAYHDQVLGFDDVEIKSAWQAFVKSGRYKSVLHMNGMMRPHYGLTNDKEFFAEMSESYFGMNDFFPFNSVELKREEPGIYDLLVKIWGPLPK